MTVHGCEFRFGWHAVGHPVAPERVADGLALWGVQDDARARSVDPVQRPADLPVRPPGRGHGFCDQCKDVFGSSGDRRHLLVGFGQADFASPVDRFVVVQEVRDLFENVDACRQRSVVRYRVHHVRDRGVQVAVVEVDLAPRRFGGRLRSYHGRGFTQGLHLDGGSGLVVPDAYYGQSRARSEGERTRPAVSRVRSVQGGRCPVGTVSCAPSTRAWSGPCSPP